MSDREGRLTFLRRCGVTFLHVRRPRNQTLEAVAIALLLALLAACTPATRDGRNGPPTSPGAPFDEVAVELLQRVNHERSRGAVCGDTRFAPAPPVRLEERLVRAAAKHSEDMRVHGSMSHAGSDGSTVGARVTREGYAWRVVAENVAWGYRTPEAVMQGWMNSPGHCAAVMGASYSELGAAEDGTYWTLVFAEPR